MGFFDFQKSDKTNKRPSIINEFGEFSFINIDGTQNYKGVVNSKINENIELLFPVNGNEISIYQTDYFREIENNWKSILQQIKIKKPQIDFRDYKVVKIMIPNKGNQCYDVDSEIVLQKNSNLISAILIGLNVDEIIDC